MSSKKWIKKWFLILFISIPIIIIFNYIVDPYGIYNMNLFSSKPLQADKMRLVKVLKINELNPKSIILGTSRAEYGYDPNHEYFLKPAYNFATSGSSMYENLLNFKHALKNKNLKKVLLVLDYRMFNNLTQKSVSEFEEYFESNFIYKLLFNVDVLKDSLKTIKNQKNKSGYLENGQKEHNSNWNFILSKGGHFNVMKYDESKYYKNYSTKYEYGDTKNNSFDDFNAFLDLAYSNNLEVDIIFGPSHVRQWESLDYFLDYDLWLKWKKDIVYLINEVANKHKKKEFKVIDFSVYHALTSEKIPKNKKSKMTYYWESSHYKNSLGLIVLNKLNKSSKFNDFGIELNLKNIDSHLEKQKLNRKKYINSNDYQLEIWGKIKPSK